MSDRRLMINSRIDTARLRDTTRDLTFYGVEAIRRYRERVDGYNPSLTPMDESVYMRFVFGKQALPEEFRNEWKTADEDLVMLMRDIQVMGNPEAIWKKLLGRFQYSTELPSQTQAKGYLNYSEARIRHLASLTNDTKMPSVELAARVYTENTMLRGGLLASTFFIPAERPNLN